MRLSYLSFLLALSLAACAPLTPTTAAIPGQPIPGGATPTYFATPRSTPTFAPTPSNFAALGLSGNLIYTQGIAGLWQIDLATGAQTQLWKLPDRGYLAGVSASPDGARLALAYAPPPRDGTPQLGATDIYLADADGTHAHPVIERTAQYESYGNPIWSPDGAWIYFTHYKPLYDDKGTFNGLLLNVERVSPTGGAPESIIASGQQASLSADGKRIVFLRFNLEKYSDALWIANADGSDAAQLVPDSSFFALAGPRLSPDGKTIVFGASGPLQSSARGLDFVEWISGAKVAKAHGPPWELWSVPAAGGQLEQVTHLGTDGPWPAWSPDGRHLAALLPGGVFLLGEGDPIFLGQAAGHGELTWGK